MRNKSLVTIAAAFSFILCSTSVFGDSYYNEDYSYSQPSYYDDEVAPANNGYANNGYYSSPRRAVKQPSYSGYSKNYTPTLPGQIATNGKRVIMIDPNAHGWGAYGEDGKLIRSGLATAGANWCPDIGRPCRTKAGVFSIQSLGSADCVSRKFPVGRGGAPMPYCMFFHGGQAIHGSNQVVPANVSHGCVRVNVEDAAWIRFNFVTVGTKVIVSPY